MFRNWPLAALVFLALPPQPLRSSADDAQDLRALGRRIYHEGRLASGAPVKATVLGDVPVDGSQFSCLHCHRSSGLGTSESRIRVLPVDGPDLFSPRTGVYRGRPAYTDDTLAELLRTGRDPAGAPIDPLMPRYDLPALEMKALIAYLRSLSASYSPGVAEDTIHFATVVTSDAPAANSQAMLDVLDAFVRAKNAETRAEGRRAQAGPFYHEYRNKAYRKWVLHVWRLRGNPSEWRRQLEGEYARQPVFAVLSGMGSSTWAPVHGFCEDMQLPCLLPNIDVPPSTTGDFYTLYFSKGLALEAEIVATDLAHEKHLREIVQVFRPGAAGAEAAASLHRAAAKTGRLRILDIPVETAAAGGLRSARPDAIVLWLTPADMELVREPGAARLYISSTLAGGASRVPDRLRRNAQLIHPYSLAPDFDGRSVRERAFFQAHGITLMPETERVQLQTYFACQVLGGALMHIKRRFYRDYLMDTIDHAQRMAAFTAVYPRLSFGPGQRYLAKGAFLVPLDSPVAADAARWIVPAL